MTDGGRHTAWREPSRTVLRLDTTSSLAGMTLLLAGTAGGALIPRLTAEAERLGACVALATPPAVPLRVTTHDPALFLVRPDPPTELERCDQLVDDALEQCSLLDAAIVTVAAPPIGAIEELSLETWHQHVIAPVRQAFWLARRVVWEFLAAGSGGRLVFVTEPLAGATGHAPAEASCEVVGSALCSLARSIAKEFGSRSVTCNTVLATPQGGLAAPTSPHHAVDPLMALIAPTLYLASEDASFVTGEALTVQC